MILDRLARAQRYRALHPDFAPALDFLQHARFHDIPLGRHEIDGDRVFVIVDHPQGKGQAAARLESHRKYIDIQLCIAGHERIGWRPTPECRQVSEPYDAQRDIEFYTDEPESFVALPEGTFAIFWPEDAHAPLAGTGEVFKAVVKIAAP